MNTWPMFAQALTAICARGYMIPLVGHVQDLYPEAITSRADTVLARALAAILKPLDAWISGSSDRLIVISRSMRWTYINDRKLAPGQVTFCANWQDERLFHVSFDRRNVAGKYGFRYDRFTFMYLGNVGAAAGVDVVIRAFANAGLTDAQLVIVGEGSEKAKCVALAYELNVPNVFFVSDPDPASVAPLQSAADVCVLPLRPGVGNYSIPSKFIAYLLSGKPVLAAIGNTTEMGEEISSESCGWVGEPGDVSWLADKMRDVAVMPRAKLDEIGARSRELGLRRYSRAGQLPILANAIEAAARRPVTVI